MGDVDESAKGRWEYEKFQNGGQDADNGRSAFLRDVTYLFWWPTSGLIHDPSLLLVLSILLSTTDTVIDLLPQRLRDRRKAPSLCCGTRKSRMLSHTLTHLVNLQNPTGVPRSNFKRCNSTEIQQQVYLSSRTRAGLWNASAASAKDSFYNTQKVRI